MYMEEQNNSEDQIPTSDPVDRSIAELQEENQMLMNSWKRTQADFENYKRRKEQENAELVEFARQVAMVKLLPSLDSIMQALQHVPDDAAKMAEWKNGVAGTVKQLDKALEEIGIRKIEAVG
jgi:molecular chaperone GrpE